jgi:hypothetical protein
MTVGQSRLSALGQVDAKTTMGAAHPVTSEHIRQNRGATRALASAPAARAAVWIALAREFVR